MYLTLGQLIERLEKEDPNKIVPMGFYYPHSYRGYYDELAFEPKAGVTVREMLKSAKSALGTTYQGWKGGDFVMDKDTKVHLALEGDCGEEIEDLLLDYMLGVFDSDRKSK